MSNWDGRERRSESSRDHDLLMRIDANLTNFMTRYQTHIDEDTEEFAEVDRRLRFLERSYWIAVGVIVSVEILIKLIK